MKYFICGMTCIVFGFVINGLGWRHVHSELQNQAIEKGYAEIRVINGERKFQWK